MRILPSLCTILAFAMPIFASAESVVTTAAVITFQDCGRAGMTPHLTLQPGYGLVVAKIKVDETTYDTRAYTGRLDVLKDLCTKDGLRSSPSLQLTIEMSSPFGGGQITKAIAVCPDLQRQAVDVARGGCLPIIGYCEGGVLVGTTTSNGSVMYSNCVPQLKP